MERAEDRGWHQVTGAGCIRLETQACAEDHSAETALPSGASERGMGATSDALLPACLSTVPGGGESGGRLEAVDLRIVVLAFTRAASLARCLHSLLSARFLGHRVTIEVLVDRGEDGQVDAETVRVAESFRHPEAAVRVEVSGAHRGLLGQWLQAWHPQPHSQELALILEDDLSLSPHFYCWLRAAHEFYGNDSRISGLALQGYTMKHALGSRGRVRGPPGEPVFLYPILGTWGFSPKAGPWRDFLAWVQTNASSSFRPWVAGLRPSLWFQQAQQRGRPHSMWSMWHVYFAWQRGLLTLYPSLPGQAGFAVNWREEGLHFSRRKQSRHSVRPDLLVREWDQTFVDFPRKPAVLDVFGNVVEEAER